MYLNVEAVIQRQQDLRVEAAQERVANAVIAVAIENDDSSGWLTHVLNWLAVKWSKPKRSFAPVIDQRIPYSC